jgi:hypothetical protein
MLTRCKCGNFVLAEISMSNGRVFRYAYITMRFRQGRFFSKNLYIPRQMFWRDDALPDF